MPTPVLRLSLLAVVLLAVPACASDTLSERDARSVKVGQVLAPSYTAAVRGTQVHLMTPSGRVDLTLSKPIDEVAAQDAQAAVPLRPTGGAKAVGVAWSLNRGGYPDVTNRQLTSPDTIFGAPQPVRLWLVTDGTRREIPDVGTLAVPRARPGNAAWVIVPSGVREWRFELDFAGVTQRVDVGTGTVTSGRAAALYRPLPIDDDGGSCDFDGGTYYESCLVDFAVGYPYVDGAGWAPTGKVFALVRVRVGSNLSTLNTVTVAGVRSVATVGDGYDQFRAYPVTPARTYAVRGRAPVETDGGTRTLGLTGTLTTGSTP